MSLGGIIIDGSNSVLDYNAVAPRVLAKLNGAHDAHEVTSELIKCSLTELLKNGDRRFHLNGASWVMVPQQDRQPVVVRAVPVGEGSDPHGRTVIILVDLGEYPEASPSVLNRMFGLTPTEAALALRIGAGATPADVAREKGVSLATVRAQLASVFAKTQTRRQSELMALLARVAILP